MIIAQFNYPIDWLTILFYIYNILILAIISMFWFSPNILKQIITIYQCIIMILYVLKIAPEWIAWILLPLLAIWDMIAVLLPFGPLYLLIYLFKKHNLEVPPMMIYTTGLWFKNQNMNDLNRKKDFLLAKQCSSLNLLFISNNTLNYFCKQKSNVIKNTNASSNENQSSKKRQTRKSMLGLGDFIFYSILLSKTVFTSQCNIFTIIIVYLCIIMGMLATIILLLILHRPLPALPISLLIGLVVFFHYNYIGNQFADILRFPTGPIII
jgi:presenilin 1